MRQQPILAGSVSEAGFSGTEEPSAGDKAPWIAAEATIFAGDWLGSRDG